MWNSATGVSLVIPAYNEQERIAGSLCAIGDYARASGATLEVIVVDDGSTDDTATVAARHLPSAVNVESRIIRYTRNRGKGFAVRQGLLATRYPTAVFSDADLSTPIEELSKLLTLIDNDDADLAFGSRALDRSLIGTHQPMRRELGGQAFNLVLRLATGLPFLDTQCGFKAFRMAVCRPLIEAGTIDGFGFDIELLYEAHRAGLRLREVPVRWNHRDGSKVSFLRDGSRMLRDIFNVRRRDVRGSYDTGIRLSGLAAQQDRMRHAQRVARDATA